MTLSSSSIFDRNNIMARRSKSILFSHAYGCDQNMRRDFICLLSSYINKGDYIGGFFKKNIGESLKTLDSYYLGRAEDMASLIIGTKERPELAKELANSFYRTNPEIAKHFSKITFLSDNRKDLNVVNISTLVIQYSKDLNPPVEGGLYVNKIFII